MNIFPKPIYLGAATRTPIGKFGGALKRFSAPQLATLALKEALSRAPEAAAPQWVFLGHARQAGAGPNPARQAAQIFSGLSDTIPAITYAIKLAHRASLRFLQPQKKLHSDKRRVFGRVE